MAVFYANNNATTKALSVGGAQTQIALIQTTTNTGRSKICEVEMGPASVPNATDCEIIYDMPTKDATTAGTAGVALATATAQDGTGYVSLNKYATNYTAEPTTYNAVGQKAWAMNQRVSYRWVAFQETDRVTLSVTTLQGAGVRAKSSTYTGNVIVGLAWREE